MGLVRAGHEPAPRRATTAESVAALASPDAEARRAGAVGCCGFAAAADPLLAALGVEDDRAARDAQLTALASLDDLDVTRAVAAHLRSDDAGLRTAVADALAGMPWSGVVLAELLAAADPATRIASLMVLSMTRPEGAGPWLRAVIADDPDPRVVAAAIGDLVDGGEPGDPALLEAASARFPDDPFVAFVAGVALARIGTS